ncbi:putative ribonuclease H-like domain-containing protein [Tanacetum coccineum]
MLEAILNTLLMNDKSKDTAKARQDLKRLGIQSGLWLGQTKNGTCLKPQAVYSFTQENRKKFCQFIKGVKLPNGFRSNFKHKQYLPDEVAKPIIELCSFFKQICSATLMEDDMLKAQSKALEGGPIRPRWMFLFERYMKKLKSYVQNKAKPKEIENQLDHKVKVIRSDNGTEFKNSIMNQFCEMKGIKREFSVARTPQQNGVAERKNRTLIEAARTMVLVIKPHNKTPYELIRGRPPLIDFMKPFGCPVTILNTRDHLGKFDGKADEGYFVGYSVVSKAMRVFNKRTRIVEETLNIRFLENTPNVKGNGPDWLFDIDSLTISMNYVPVVAGNKTNGIAGTKDNTVAGQAQKEKEPEQEYILIPICTTDPSISQGPKDRERDTGMKPTEVDENEASDTSGKDDEATRSESERLNQREMQTENTNSTNGINTISTLVSTAGPTVDTAVPSPPVNTVGPSGSTANAFEEHLFERFSPFKNAFSLPPVPNISSMDNTSIFGNCL